MEVSFLKIARKIALLGVFLVFGFGLVASAQAATQYFSPSTGSYSAGSSFSVGVYTTSSDQPASAFSGYLKFPTDKLSVTSVSTAGSVVSIWVQEPTYSNAAGTVDFEGFIPNPGFTGSGGKLVTITFQVKGSGAAVLAYNTGSVLANDGLGTDITTGLGSANFTLGGGEPVEPGPSPTPEPAKPTVPTAPYLSSSSHPNSETWYQQTNPKFAVSYPAGTTGVSVLFNQEAKSVPGTVSDGLQATYAYQDVADGVWYFHARTQNAQGWGPAAHLPVRIDSTAPLDFQVTPVESQEPGQLPTLNLLATDSLSGISRYVIAIDGQEVMTVPAQETAGSAVATLPAQTSGSHMVTVSVFDNAGNSQVQTLDVVFTESMSELAPAPVHNVSRWADKFLKLVKVIVLILLCLAIALGFIYAVVLVLRHSHRAVKHVVAEVSPVGEARLRRALRALRHDLHRNLFRLERTRRTRNLSEKTERSIRTTVKALDDLEDKITHTLQDI